MSAQHEEKVRQHMADAVALARGRAPDMAALFEPFMRHYYGLADPEDVVSRSVADLYGAAMAHWQLGQKFVSGQPRVRVYNPSLEQHGWYCGHTVVEIVNDDMPFLFDSVTMEINRQGLALHSAFHPVYRMRRDASGTRTAVEAGGMLGARPGAGAARFRCHAPACRVGQTAGAADGPDPANRSTASHHHLENACAGRHDKAGAHRSHRFVRQLGLHDQRLAHARIGSALRPDGIRQRGDQCLARQTLGRHTKLLPYGR